MKGLSSTFNFAVKIFTSNIAIEFYKICLAILGMLLCAYLGLVYIHKILENYQYH